MAGKRYFAVGKETTYGTAVAAARYDEGLASFKPDLGWNIPSPVATREAKKRGLGQYRTRGTLGDFDIVAEGVIGELLLGVLGSVSTSTPTGGVKLHAFTPADSLPSYTVRLGVEQTERVLPGGLIEALTVRFPHDDNVKDRSEIYSGFEESTVALATPSFSALECFNMPSGGGTLTIAGSDKKSLLYDMELTIKNNIPFDRGDLAGRTFATKRYGERLVTGKLSTYFDNTTEYDRFMAGNEFTLIVEVLGALITGSYYYSLKFELRKCVYLKDLAPDIVAQNAPLVADAPFRAFYDTTGGFNAEVKAWLQNTISSY